MNSAYFFAPSELRFLRKVSQKRWNEKEKKKIKSILLEVIDRGDTTLQIIKERAKEG